MNAINDFAPADHPSHPANHPGPGQPVSTRSVPWHVDHLLDPEADAGGVSESEMAERAREYDDLIFAHGTNGEFDAFADRAPGLPPGDDRGYPTLAELRARRDAAAKKGDDPDESTEDTEKDPGGDVDTDQEPDADQEPDTDDDDDEEAALAAALAALDGK